jgi:hypothetical protein
MQEPRGNRLSGVPKLGEVSELQEHVMIAKGLGLGVFGDVGQTQGHERITQFPFRPQVELDAKRRPALRRSPDRAADEGHLFLELRLRDGIQDLLHRPLVWQFVPGLQVLHELTHCIAVFGAQCGWKCEYVPKFAA